MKLLADQIRRFESKVAVEPNTSCHLWLGAVGKNGYGRVKLRPRHLLAHRVAYEHYVGPIPSGLVLDHLCRQRCCVNPAHLEPVTNAENTRRSDAVERATAQRRARARCRSGHELSGSNLYLTRDGRRSCRTCKRLADERFRERRRQAPPARVDVPTDDAPELGLEVPPPPSWHAPRPLPQLDTER